MNILKRMMTDENDMMTVVAIFAIEFSTLGECTTMLCLSS